MKIAKEKKSSVLASNAVHHRIDSLTSIVALMTIGGAHVIADASWLDPVGGLIISAMVIRAGWQNTWTSLLELADVSLDQEVKQSVERAARKALTASQNSRSAGGNRADEVQIKEIQGTKSGQNYLIDIELAVPSSFTLADMQPLEDAVRERCGAKVRGVRKVRVKFTSTTNPTAFDSEFIPANVSPRSSPEPEDEQDEHNHRHANGTDKKQK